jgi:magnesium chelatase subunit H
LHIVFFPSTRTLILIAFYSQQWIASFLSNYMVELQNRLLSRGLHALGAQQPTEAEIKAYLEAYYYGDELKNAGDLETVLRKYRTKLDDDWQADRPEWLTLLVRLFQGSPLSDITSTSDIVASAFLHVASLLKRSTEELDAIVNALDGGYVVANSGGDRLRDGASVLSTGRNIHALDPYRMPSVGAWTRGQKAATEFYVSIVVQPPMVPIPKATVVMTLCGLDAIKARGESVVIVLALVGAEPVKEGTGRVVLR